MILNTGNSCNRNFTTNVCATAVVNAADINLPELWTKKPSGNGFSKMSPLPSHKRCIPKRSASMVLRPGAASKCSCVDGRLTPTSQRCSLISSRLSDSSDFKNPVTFFFLRISNCATHLAAHDLLEMIREKVRDLSNRCCLSTSGVT